MSEYGGSAVCSRRKVCSNIREGDATQIIPRSTSTYSVPWVRAEFEPFVPPKHDIAHLITPRASLGALYVCYPRAAIPYSRLVKCLEHDLRPGNLPGCSKPTCIVLS